MEDSTNEKSGTIKGLKSQQNFILALAVCLCAALFFHGHSQIAMWLGFLFAGYSAIANDSIQTIGTFIASNRQRPWWQLWIFISAIFVATMYMSWVQYGGPVGIQLDELHDSEGKNLNTITNETVLRITMQNSTSTRPLYREMRLPIENGTLHDRESLGIEIALDYKVIDISLGQVDAPSVENPIVWGTVTPETARECLNGQKPLKIEESEELRCWRRHTPGASNEEETAYEWDEPLPKGATQAPPFITLYASSTDSVDGSDGVQIWNMSQRGRGIGAISVAPKVGGDVSNQRLVSKGFDTQTNDFHFLQIIAPLFLILFTRLRMPVSTTFLLLNIFAASGKSVGAVAFKSMSGYGIAFVISILLWAILGKAMKRWFQGEAHPAWRIAQWVTTGCLWSVWLMQDAANIAVFLPRALTVSEFMIFCGVIVVGLGWLFRIGGERIQEVVTEKSHVVDVRAATVLDFVYAVILYIFKFSSKIPMSTTWVFVGLLAGREIALAWRGVGEDDRSVKEALRLAGRDLLYVTIGFVFSIILAAMINPVIREAFFG